MFKEKIYKYKGLMWGVALGVIAITCYAGYVFADNGEPGSATDPLVTKSFVEKYVNERINALSLPAQAIIVEDYSNPEGYSYAEDSVSSSSYSSTALIWNVETLYAGESFIGNAGTEIIVRSGTASVVDPSGSGIPDLTDGQNMLDGQKVPNDHLFSLPRSDGRGIQAQTEVIFMYRGY